MDKFGILSVDLPLYTAETQTRTKQPTKTVPSNFISLVNGGNYVTLPILKEIPIEPPCQSNEYIYMYILHLLKAQWSISQSVKINFYLVDLLGHLKNCDHSLHRYNV